MMTLGLADLRIDGRRMNLTSFSLASMPVPTLQAPQVTFTAKLTTPKELVRIWRDCVVYRSWAATRRSAPPL